MRSNRRSSFFWGILLIGLGILFLADNFGLVDSGDVFYYGWPLILVWIGFSIIRSSSAGRAKRSFHELGIDVDASSGSQEAGTWNSNVFGDVENRIAADGLANGTYHTVFGDIRIEIEGQTTKAGTYQMFFSTVFGNIHLRGSKEIGYAVSGSTVFGDVKLFEKKAGGIFSDLNLKTSNFETAAVKIIVQGNTVFGNIRIGD